MIGARRNGNVVTCLLEAYALDQHGAVRELEIDRGGIRGFVGNAETRLIGWKRIKIRLFQCGGERLQEPDGDQLVGRALVEAHRRGNNRVRFIASGRDDGDASRSRLYFKRIGHGAKIDTRGNHLAIDQHIERSGIG